MKNSGARRLMGHEGNTHDVAEGSDGGGGSAKFSEAISSTHSAPTKAHTYWFHFDFGFVFNRASASRGQSIIDRGDQSVSRKINHRDNTKTLVFGFVF